MYEEAAWIKVKFLTQIKIGGFCSNVMPQAIMKLSHAFEETLQLNGFTIEQTSMAHEAT